MRAMSMMSQSLPTPMEDVSATMRTNFVGFASFTILVWDHMITFADEVDYIWKGKKGPSSHLSISPGTLLLSLYANSTKLKVTESLLYASRLCNQSLRLLISKLDLRTVSTFHPLRGMYCCHCCRGCRNNDVIEDPRTLPNSKMDNRSPSGATRNRDWDQRVVDQSGRTYVAVLHNSASGVHACSMIFDPSISAAASASAWYPLLYDSIVFALTVNRTLPSIRKKQAGFILKKLLEDGVLYYSVIFAITFVLTFMIVGAPPGIKNICAQTEQLITVAMMSRITLSLRKAGRSNHHEPLIVQVAVGRGGSGPELLSITSDFAYDQSLRPCTIEEATEAGQALALTTFKPPERLVLHGRAPIQFALPPSPGPKSLSEYPFSL
ncbi:hypothetical protein MIND_00875800 [Mycena indigotica]|uniref:DUF6533 domain-containing protein n=1 Tax=Mycena indigotica TaxID=2126181 RepID=A0A8H6SGX4_9AGAR|nr:uncharacterized protein MIND_00875800 [Mycena indigotica]KAF7299271.1 hypothetical protein MIND_00875800 [Mycena indigotica]